MDGLGFYVGRFFIAYYGACIAAGILAAAFVGWLQVKRYAKSFDDFILLSAIGGLSGIIGAKVLYLAVSFKQIDFSRLGELEYINTLMTGGFVFYGGLIGGLLGLFLCRRHLQIDVKGYLSICIPCLPIVHGFGRIGCSLVGCCYGCPYEGWGSIIYKNSMFAPNNQRLFPVQGMEALIDFIIAGSLLFYINGLKGKKSMELYLGSYAIMRFALEFFRYDGQERGMMAGLSTSQYISMGIIAGVFLYHFVRKNKAII